MTKKLFIGALITTPLLVLNSVLATYLQGRVTVQETLLLGLIIGLYVVCIWLINIALVSKIEVEKSWQLYVLSFILVVLFSVPYRWLFGAVLPGSNLISRIPTYPMLNALIVNSMTWVIIELVRSGEQKKLAEATIDKLKIQNLEAQKQSLIRQLQPHFLFNALSTLKSLISESQKDAEAYTVKLSKFLRYSFSIESAELTLLREELDFVQNYIELQSIRFENAFTYKIDIPEKILKHQVPVLALQTLVENIFKHNYFSDQKPLHFSITYADEQITVWNEKVGLKLTDRNETGLLNLNKRYELLNGTNISIENNDQEFAVTIPLIKQ